MLFRLRILDRGFFSCLCVLLCAARISSSPLSLSFSSLFHFLCFLTPSPCESRLYSGARLRPRGFTSHTPRWQFVVPHTQTMTCTFLSCPTWWPCSCECVTGWNGIFSKRFFFFFFFELNAEHRQIPVSPVTGSLALWVSRPHCFIPGCEWYIISPAGRCEPVVSFMISIDESSRGESISQGGGAGL